MAHRFYAQNAQSVFVKEFGLMQRQLDRLGLDAKTEEMFMAMMDAIHRHASGTDTLGEE